MGGAFEQFQPGGSRPLRTLLLRTMMLLCTAGLLCVAHRAHASDAARPPLLQEPLLNPNGELPPDRPLLPHPLAPPSSTFLSLGMTGELSSSGRGQDKYLGLAGVLRYKAFGPHLALLVSPSRKGFEDWGMRAVSGLRGYYPVGSFAFSYGVSANIEARLDSHYWLAHVTPIELGAVIYQERSWQIELLTGARHTVAGALINNFLIDPNGLDNENAQDEVTRLLQEQPWQGFVRVVFGRKLDL